MLSEGWPLIIATDGGAGKFQSTDIPVSQSSASASVVIFHPPSIPFEKYINASKTDQAAMLNQNLLPWTAHASSLPTRIGNHPTDNAHAECFAVILMEEWIPQNIPILLIMDSEAERDHYTQLQNVQHTTHWFLLCSLMSGVSKCLGNRLSIAISKHHNTDENLRHLITSNIGRLCSHAKTGVILIL